MESESFPRGGKRIVNDNIPVKRKHDDNLFAAEKQPKVKKVRKEKPVRKEVNREEEWRSSLRLQGTLTYNKMQEGMVILSCVKHISNLALQMEFPGLTFGLVTINNISDIFTKELAAKLQKEGEESCVGAVKNIICEGQLMPAKIVSVKDSEKGYQVQATINPRDVNSDKIHNSFRQGTVIWANVVSELDHGYELTVGVNNCRVFLPHKNIDASKTYDNGEPLYCVINKVVNSDSATTLTVSAKQEHVKRPRLEDDFNLNDIIPGTKVDFLVEEVVPSGVKGHFLENCFGYLDESQIYSKINIEKLREGSKISAHVLFTEPVTKVTYLTLREFEVLPKLEHAVGKVLSARVVSHASKGLNVQLGKSAGFVTNKRLLNTLRANAQMDVTDAIRRSFPVGSHHKCRILDYNHMQQMYICTFEKNVIKEKIFKLTDLKVGQLVRGTVEKILRNGLIVKTGNVQGFVPNLHVSSVKYSENIKAKFYVGMSVDARVLKMSDENVTFTLKQGLVESENCLAKMEDVLPNTQHVGFVVDTKTSGALVAFYDNVTGWISSKELNSGNSGRYTDPQGYFFKGQVVTVWILGLKDGKIQLSLNCPTAKKKRIKLGEVVDATIKKITSSGLKVEAGPHKAAATVPLAHLCETLSVCPLLLKTYQRGQQLTNLMCVRNTPSVVLSRREALAHEKNSTKIPELHNLKKNMLLRCSFESSCDSGIYVFAPIKNYYKNIFVLRKNVVSKVWPPTFEEEQLILATVLKVNYKAKKIDLAIEYDDVRDQGVDTLLNSLSSTIEDLHYIVDLHQENHMKLTEYKIGERVQCQIKKIDSDGNCKVTLPNGTKGSVASHLSSPNPVGSVVEGVVLDFNFGGGYVEICTKTNIKQMINKVQNGVAQKSFYSSCVAQILLVTKLYVLGVLKDTQCNRQLIYLPVGCTEQEKILHNDKLKVVIHRRIHSKIIGVPKKCGTVEKDIDIEDKPKRKRKKTKVSDVSKDVPAECEALESEKEETHGEFGETEETNGEFSETEETNEEFSETEEANGEFSETEEINGEFSETEEINEEFSETEEANGEFSETEEINGEFSETEEINGEFSETEEINGGFSETDEINGEFRETEEINGEFSKTEKHNSDQEMDSDSENATSADRSDHVSSDNSNIKKRGALLSGARSFYGADDDKVKDESSSDEEEESESKKSKKSVPAKKSEMIKLEEERIAKIEKELADSIAKPQTAEQFDRLLLASPNSSELWLQYMAMHVAAAELEKARVIGKKAIETINMTLTKEKFNVWIAFLNLENMYGTKESFENIFEDAVKYNDSLDVYLSVIKMLASAGKLVEMEEKIKKVKSKHKQNTKMWLELGQVYYSLGKFREARNIKEAALKSILDKKRQFDLIVRFGTMEFQFGELEQAIANFETILDTYPHKTTIWIIYVDQLVKQEKYETAREVLERAVSLKLGVRAMKSLFQKFIHFEEQHGTAETVEEVKKRARDYVENLGVN